MTGPFKINLKEATRLTRLGKLNDAVGAIMRGLRPGGADASDPQTDLAGDALSDGAPKAQPDRPTARSRFSKPNFPDLGATSTGTKARSKLENPGSFTEHVYSNAAGSRTYKLYVPKHKPLGAMPLIVMLHGCTQDPDDFAAGTRMNELAEEYGFLVAYPAQPKTANASKCWNWFSVTDQRRGAGEPSLIAGITEQIVGDHPVNPGKVFIAGLSAGGAAAAIMAETYPDLYSAAGVHSGLACGAARDVASAFTAMKQGPVAGSTVERAAKRVPIIVFHGDSDKTVHPCNVDWIIGTGDGGPILETKGRFDAGVDYTCAVHFDQNGETVAENWTVHGGGHAWFGGSSAGSYTDPNGPDASRQMVRFFLDHARH